MCSNCTDVPRSTLVEGKAFNLKKKRALMMNRNSGDEMPHLPTRVMRTESSVAALNTLDNHMA